MSQTVNKETDCHTTVTGEADRHWQKYDALRFRRVLVTVCTGVAEGHCSVQSMNFYGARWSSLSNVGD